ncbi:MAG: choice-of-anchor D domain-containing protein, partial [Ignavibacteriae bacterium]|nr:choice-of-anchor D domain-containing protein [Ignavibacteriota bacterium]
MFTPSVISSGGVHAQAGGVQISFTVGEAGGITTNTAGGITLTQGFQQVDPVTSTSGGSGNTPIIYTTANLSTFTTTVGTPSSAQSFTISGQYLTGNISLSAPSSFEISISSGSGYGSSLNLTPISGSVATTSIYVRYNPSAAGQHSGNISCTSSGATTQNVAVNGTTGVPAPVIITSVSVLNAFTTNAGTPSSSVGFTVNGNDLTANLVVTAPSEFEVSTSSNSGFGSSVSFTPSSGKVNNQTVYVRYNPAASGSHSGNVVCSSTGAASKNVAVSGNSTGNPIPTIVTSVSSLNAFATTVGTPSSVQNFTVSGSDLSSNIDVTAPSQYEISTSSTTGFGSSVSLAPSSGIVNAVTIYVRYNPTAVGSHNGNINCISTGATAKTVSLTGTASAGSSTPTIVTSVSSLNAFAASVGTPSSAQNFTVSGTNLTANIAITAPNQYEVSLSSGSGYASSLSLNPTSGTVNTTTIYVRYNPSAAGSHAGSISCTSTNAVTQNVLVNGSTTGSVTPVIITSTNSLVAFSTQVGTPSTPQIYTVTGTDLTGLLLVSAPADFQVSLSSTTGFAGSVYFNPVSGKVNNGVVYVRYNPTTAGSHSGNVDNVSAGATSVSVSVSGTATLPAGPVVTSTNVSATFSTQVGTPSAAQAIAVSGLNLIGNLSITSPTNFEISLTSGSGFTNSLSIAPTAGTVSTTIVYVRYNPSAAGTHSGSVIVSSQGANTQSV